MGVYLFGVDYENEKGKSLEYTNIHWRMILDLVCVILPQFQKYIDNYDEYTIEGKEFQELRLTIKGLIAIEEYGEEIDGFKYSEQVDNAYNDFKKYLFDYGEYPLVILKLLGEFMDNNNGFQVSR